MAAGERVALVVGATGLIGAQCVELLSLEETYREVRVLTRRELGRPVSERVREHVVDFDQLERAPEVFSVDDVYCCLGTTMKVAGSREGFRKVDYDYVLSVAKLARANGAKRFALVSSIGADASAWNFYLRVKGEVERDVRALGFETLELLRPGILQGERREKRSGEAAGLAVMRAVAPWMVGGLRAYRPVEANTVAKAMVRALVKGEPGARVRTYDEIVGLAEGG